ncbi:MAG: hypothetical protein NTU81_01535 [Candidatus Nomurabacteria bacterium]|nr:hypothetical protein [Candidatus Nomurabacteria bacterium]
MSLDDSKGFIISFGVTLSCFFWLISRLGEGKFVFPKDRLIVYAALIPLVFLISSFFSSSLNSSLWGNGFELGTFGSILIMFLLFFLSSIFFQTEKRLWYFIGALFIGALLISIFEIFNIVVILGNLPGGFLVNLSAGNLIGNWNDFALFFGLIILLSIFNLEFLKLNKIFTTIQYFLLVTGLMFIAIINTPFVWFLVGIFSIIIFVYSISTQHSGMHLVHKGDGKKRFPFSALVVVLISFVFLVGGGAVSNLVSKYINISNSEVRPSISATSGIVWKSIKHNPLFGTSPNTFSMDWVLWQPKEVAQTIFWSIDFPNGVSMLSTFVATTGIVGLLAWVIFFIVFVIRGVQSSRIASKDSLSNYYIFSILLISIYSWISFIFYSPGVLILMLAFISSGVFIGILVSKKVVSVKEFYFLDDPRKSFFTILLLVFLMITTLSVTYLQIEKFVSILYFSKAIKTDNTMQSLSISEKMIKSAISLNKSDVYYRALSQIYVGQIGLLVKDNKLSSDVLKSNLQQLINLSLNSASLAINQNPKQYLNYVNMGNIYSSLVLFSVDGSYSNASNSYKKAQELAPNNPSIFLDLANLEITNKNNTEARNFIEKALVIKPNYTDALFLLAKIEVDEGNMSAAVKQVEKASAINPNDSTIFFRLGLLRYNNSDYINAVSSFEQAVLIDNSYWNARYFLGLSYQKVGRNNDALVQFNILNKISPNNQDINAAIDSLSKPAV